MIFKKNFVKEKKDDLANFAGKECHGHVNAALNNHPKSNWFDETLKVPKTFKRDIYLMTDSILKDPIKPYSIEDLGLSQVYRLYGFLNPEKNLPCIPLEKLKGLPIIGAEFHFKGRGKKIEDKLFILNMAQYHEESRITFSKLEQRHGMESLFEIRMNPSYYPITTANWGLMKNFAPLEDLFFSLTITPLPKTQKKLDQIKSLANIIYSNNYSHSIEPKPKKDYSNIFELYIPLAFAGGAFTAAAYGLDWKWYSFIAGLIAGGSAGIASSIALDHLGIFNKYLWYGDLDFGEYYLGQTQTLKKGIFEFCGNYAGRNYKIPKEIDTSIHPYDFRNCQLNLYSGFGKIFPKQAYYISMGYLDSEILEIVGKETGGNISIQDAVKLNKKTTDHILEKINQYIENNRRLSDITRKGNRIIKSFMY